MILLSYQDLSSFLREVKATKVYFDPLTKKVIVMSNTVMTSMLLSKALQNEINSANDIHVEELSVARMDNGMRIICKPTPLAHWQEIAF